MSKLTKNTLNKKLLRTRLKLAVHVERMEDKKLTNRLDAQKVEKRGGEED